MRDVAIVAAVRTPIGKFGGALSRTPAADLGAHVIRALLERTGVAPAEVSEVIMGRFSPRAAAEPGASAAWATGFRFVRADLTHLACPGI